MDIVGTKSATHQFLSTLLTIMLMQIKKRAIKDFI
jgi:hypothetical protein